MRNDEELVLLTLQHFVSDMSRSLRHLEWQKSQNINCPVLYLEQSYNTQGEALYKMRPNIFSPNGGQNSHLELERNEDLPSSMYEESLMLDASRNDPPYNNNAYPGFDPQNQYIGLEVPIDKMFHEQESNVLSDNPMDENWGGVKYTQKAIDSGKYQSNNVSIGIK